MFIIWPRIVAFSLATLSLLSLSFLFSSSRVRDLAVSSDNFALTDLISVSHTLAVVRAVSSFIFRVLFSSSFAAAVDNNFSFSFFIAFE